MEMIVLLQLVILFIVIFDPLSSLVVFLTASKKAKKKERKKMAMLAIIVATTLSFLVILLGNNLLSIFNTTLSEFKIAGGIVLGILGIHMALGTGATDEISKKNHGKAVAAIIGTPLLTGPATITAILISINEYGRIVTLIAVSIVLVITALLFFLGNFVEKYINNTVVQALSTILGLVTIAWGVKFITEGIKAIFLLV